MTAEIDRQLTELAYARQKIMAGGGEKRVAKQHESGKMTARERIDTFCDPGSFVELDMFVQHRCSNFGLEEVEAPGEGVAVGHGVIGGRRVCLAAQDFTVIGGSLGEMHAAKICKVMDLAQKIGAPFISLNDSGGARIQEGVDALKGYGDIFYRNTIASGVIPQISVILGPCAGGAVYSPALTDFTFMAQGANMFITGPEVIKAVTGESVTFEELGGAMTHNRLSGVAHFVAKNDAECLAAVKKLLSFLPDNNLEEAPPAATDDDPNRIDETLRDIVPVNPNKPYDVRDIIGKVVDDGDFFEVQPYFAQNIVIGFGRLHGRSVGIIANQPKVMAGCLDINASDKAARFVRTCDAFNIPLLTFSDVPGYLPGVGQEHGGVIRHGAKLLYAYSEASVPKVTIILRKAYGGAYIAMCSRHLGADLVYALPTAEIAVMGPSGAANIIFRKEIAAAANPEEVRQQRIEEFRDRFANPYVAAARGFVDDVIDPAEMRPLLVNAFAMLQNKRETRPAKKHGNFPV